MFVERLTTEDFIEFSKQFNLDFNRFLPLNNNQYRIDLINNENNKKVYFYVTDFDLKVEKFYKFYPDEIEGMWFEFLYNKFGNDYKKAFNENQFKNNKLNSEMIN